MFDKEEINEIIEYIKNTLNLSYINIKDVSNIFFLIEWNFIKKTDYRLFNFTWTNNLSENIKIIKNGLIKNNFELQAHTRYENIITNKNDYKLTSYIKKSIEEVLLLEDLINKSEFYFLELLPFDLSYNQKIVKNIDIEELVKKKENKEY